MAAVAAGQYGLISRAQALGAGLSAMSIHRRIRSGRWEAVHPGVYRIAGSSESWKQRLLAACLWAGPGSVASHLAAARLWRLDGIGGGEVVEISVPRSVSLKREGVLLHHVSQLGPEDRKLRDGIPTTSLPRTLIDLAGVLDSAALELALDDALRRGAVEVGWLRRRLRALGRRGRQGAGELARLLSERDRSKEKTDSALEGRVLQVLRGAGVAPPERHFPICDGMRLVAEVDFAYPAAQVAVEADGYRFHSGRRAWERDRLRLSSLAALGWRVVHVTWDDVQRRPADVAATVRRALERPAG